jgi:FkbM family methyltransferase
MLAKLLRNLPDFKGKRRLGKFLLQNTINNAEDLIVKGYFDCSYILPNLKETVASEIFINGIYERETIDLLRKVVPLNGRLLDLGANIGSVIIPLCKVRKDINAVAVEAAPWVYAYLKKNIELNKLNNIQTLNKALYDADNLELDFFSPKEKFAKGSLSPVFTSDAVKVKTIMVDTLIKELNFFPVSTIKIDVEGFEYFVFKGASGLLGSDNAPDILFEFMDWAENFSSEKSAGRAQQFLLDMGYTLYTLEKDKLQKLNSVMSSGNANLFASKKASELLSVA